MRSSFLHNLCLRLCGPIPYMLTERSSIEGKHRGNVTIKLGGFRELDELALPTLEVLDLESGSVLESSSKWWTMWLVVTNAVCIFVYGLLVYSIGGRAFANWMLLIQPLVLFWFFNFYMARLKLASPWSRSYEPGRIVFESLFGRTVWSTADCRFDFFCRRTIFTKPPYELMTPVICRHEPTQKRLLLWPRQRDMETLLASLVRDSEHSTAPATSSHPAEDVDSAQASESIQA